MNPELLLAFLALALAFREARAARNGSPVARRFFALWLLLALGFSAYVIWPELRR